MDMIDTHLHLMIGRQFKYDWASGIDALKSQDFDLEQYSNLAVPAGITNAIFMETGINDEFSQAEAIYAKSLADDKLTLVNGVIAGCFPENNIGFEDWLERTADANYVGYRRILHTEPNELSQSNVFIDNVKKIGDRNKCFDMCFQQSQLPLAVKLAKACSNTQLILNHCGVPDIANGNFKSWASDISKLAELENTVCKISGILAYAPDPSTAVQAITPYVEHCIEAFGWDRVVWGGDWPVVNMTSSISDWTKISKDLVSKEDITNQEKLFSKNTTRIYGL